METKRGMKMIEIPVWKIRLHPAFTLNDPDCDFPKVYSLAKDIEMHGLKEPITVFLRDKNELQINEYTEECSVMVDDGHHRFLALKMLNWKEIPCEINQSQTKTDQREIETKTINCKKRILYIK